MINLTCNIVLFEDKWMRRKQLIDFPFDKEAFKEILIKARGERSQAEFSKDCLLSYAYLNKYSNGKMEDAPTIGTIKKIAAATKTVTFAELLSAAGYDAKKYESERPIRAARKDLFYPVMIGIANSSFDWRIESQGYKEKEPFEVMVERDDVKKWFFVPVTKKNITKEEIANELLENPKFVLGSKISFLTDDTEIYNKLKEIEFPLLSIYLSAVKICGQEIEEEVNLKTSLNSNITICNKDLIRPLSIDE